MTAVRRADVTLDIEQDRRKRRSLQQAPRLDLARHIREASRRHRLSRARLLAEMARLATGPGYVSPSEYFYYRLFDPSMPWEDKTRFIGMRMQPLLHAACNDIRWRVLADDKIIFHALMRAAELPIPKILAVYHPARAVPGTAAVLRDREEVERFLRSVETELFAKPFDGSHSIGSLAIEGMDRDGDTLRTAHDGRIGVRAFLDYMQTHEGYLFQERLRPHPQIERLFGPALSTIRMLVFLEPSGPKLASAVCKIPVGGNIADNFWRGNLLGAVHADSGVIARTVRGVGIDQARHERHPDTGRQIVGEAIPAWREARTLCLEAATLFQGIRTQAWDIAITDTGPVLVELNFGGDLNLAQLAWGRGLLDDAYREHLRTCGFRPSSFAARAGRSLLRHAGQRLRRTRRAC